MAEIELSALVRQCSHRRIPDRKALIGEVKAWEEQRNAEVVKVHWQFTTADAGIKLKSLYSQIQICQTTRLGPVNEVNNHYVGYMDHFSLDEATPTHK